MFEWKSEYSVGFDHLDRLNQKYIRAANKIYSGLNQPNRNDAMIEALDEILEYISIYFPEEERMMRADEYPWIDSHKQEHRKFLEDILDFQLGLIAGKNISPLKIGAVLYNWLTDHIGGLDKRYPIFLFVRSAA
ncbi:MAG: hemerythrin family protein [Nitrospinota bacterium]|nr:hemerythrin family protein [Nitrospinota bacterium]